jgi:alcohol dehydrogenase
MLDLVVAGRLDPARLITRRIGLDEVPDALAAMSASSPPGVTVITLSSHRGDGRPGVPA